MKKARQALQCDVCGGVDISASLSPTPSRCGEWPPAALLRFVTRRDLRRKASIIHTKLDAHLPGNYRKNFPFGPPWIDVSCAESIYAKLPPWLQKTAVARTAQFLFQGLREHSVQISRKRLKNNNGTEQILITCNFHFHFHFQGKQVVVSLLILELILFH